MNGAMTPSKRGGVRFRPNGVALIGSALAVEQYNSI